MHERVLIVGTVPFNRATPSRAFASYFSNWESENLAQIFSNPRPPVKGHCGTLYQITDARMLKRWLKKDTRVGRIFTREELADEWPPEEKGAKKSLLARLYNWGSKKSPLNYLLRGLLWRKKFWCDKELNGWLDAFRPECIFLAFSDDFFIPRIALYAAERYGVPIISCIGDDYYFNDKRSLSPFYHLYRKKYKKLIDRVLSHGGSAAYIGDKIRDKYNSVFPLDGKTVYLTSELSRHPFRPINTDSPVISYCGNVRLGRGRALCDIADALGEINKNLCIDVYSAETDAAFRAPLERHPHIRFHGAVPYARVKEVMAESDLLLVVEGFDEADIRLSRYSLSTKVADSLAVGGSILTYGSPECGAISYMQEIDCGPVCTKKEELIPAITALFDDSERQARYYQNAADITARHHSLDASNAIVEDLVTRAVADLKKQPKQA